MTEPVTGSWSGVTEPVTGSFCVAVACELQARKVDGNSDWLSFLSGKAVTNRLRFHGELLTLLAAQEGAAANQPAMGR